jgi:hypothetical protein
VNGFKNPGCPQGSDLASIFWNLKAHLDMTLCPKMINLIGLEVINEVDELLRVGKVPIVKEKFCPNLVGILIDMVNTASVEGACPPDKSMDFIALSEKKLRKI